MKLFLWDGRFICLHDDNNVVDPANLTDNNVTWKMSSDDTVALIPECWFEFYLKKGSNTSARYNRVIIRSC